jgi:hypothetical protein
MPDLERLFSVFHQVFKGSMHGLGVQWYHHPVGVQWIQVSDKAVI